MQCITHKERNPFLCSEQKTTKQENWTLTHKNEKKKRQKDLNKHQKRGGEGEFKWTELERCSFSTGIEKMQTKLQ